jgi:hypothetical protein
MALPYLVAGVGVGVYIKGGALWESVFWGGATWAVAQAIVHPISTGRMVLTGGKYALTTSIQTASGDLLASTAATQVAAIGLGAVSGAVVGTAVSQAIWGEEGAKQALTFYGFDAGEGEANYWGDTENPGYFNIPGNAKKIWQHYLH